MAEMLAIVGESGSGKTTSIRNLNPKSTFIISTTGKRPGIRGAKKLYPTAKVVDGKLTGNFYTTANVDNISKILKIVDQKLTDVKTVIIDDYQYVMGFEAMDRCKEVGYSKFTDMAQHAYQVLKSAMNLRDDLYVAVLTHSENVGTPEEPSYRIKTLGKMINSVITLEGLFTYVLFTKVVRGEDNNIQYKFITNSDGTCTAKTPIGLFPDLLIDNDLKFVIDSIKKYNGEDVEEPKKETKK